MLRGTIVFEGPTRRNVLHTMQHPLPSTTGRQPIARTLAALFLTIIASCWLTVTAAPASAAGIRATPAELTFVGLINADRRRSGLAPLSLSLDLTSVARTWSAAMADAGNISHNPQLGRQLGSWITAGENVGYGGGAVQLHLAFMASPEHQANVLSRGYTQVGIGVVERDGTMYVTEDFRRPARGTISATANEVRLAHLAHLAHLAALAARPSGA